MDWTLVLAEERARQADREAEAVRPVQPKMFLRRETVAALDRVAAVQGMTRSELAQAMFDLYLASWRPMGVR